MEKEEIPENYEFFETLAICMGDSIDPKNNLPYGQAYQRAKAICALKKQGKYKADIEAKETNK